MNRTFPTAHFSRFSLCALSFLLASCGQYGRLSEDEKTTSVALGSTANGRPRFAAPGAFAGGVMIWGVSEKQKVAIVLSNETEVSEKVLKNGDWVFHAIGWSGTSQLGGSPSCGTTVKKLAGADTTVEINLTATGCADPFFTGSSSAALKKLRFTSCTGLLAAPDANSDCDGLLRGDLNSFRLKVEGYEPTAPGEIPVLGQSLSSACVSTSASSYALSQEFIPVGLVGNSAIGLTIEGFSGPGCGGALTTFRFPQGLRNPALTGGAIFKPDSSSYSNRHSLYLVHGPVPAPTVSTLVPSVGSWGGGTLLKIYGTNFDANTTVTVGGMNCPVQVPIPTPTMLTCAVQRPALSAPGIPAT
ncbi:MAG: hypothetical protein EOP11_25630, partial [Proteobacteria bacterium]